MGEIINNSNNMQIIKRNGTKQNISFDKIIARISGICNQLNLDRIDPIKIAQMTIQGVYNNMHTRELDFYAAQKCSEMIIDDIQYGRLAGGLCMSNLQKETSDNFMTTTDRLYKLNLITPKYYNIVKKNQYYLKQIIDYDRDYLFDFFAYKTLERAYLLKDKTNKTSVIIERPQDMIMRVAITVHENDLTRLKETYDLMSNQFFTHASPTLYNSGALKQQLSSCFLMHMGDNIDDIFGTLTDAAKISKFAGGIAISISDIRGKGSYIKGTNGRSDGIVPLARHVNTLVRYINQGGRRNGAIALYIEPWHPDVIDFCELKLKTGIDEKRARDIFLALWISDLFMKRVKNNEMWSLMCPNECPNLTSTYGTEFEELYLKYEKEKKYVKQIKASDLWHLIWKCQTETGVPYMLYKDHVNKKSNQKNIGVIRSSNLCCEIVEHSNKDEIAVCNLGSLCLSKFVKSDDVDDDATTVFDYDKLLQVTRVLTRNLNKIIDVNFYPVDKAKVSNNKHRPIGVGVQGLADVYCKMGLAYDSPEAMIINKKIFETIYFGALQESCQMAKEDGPYSTFKGSPASQGILQYHMCNMTEKDLLMGFDWTTLIKDIVKHGIRNSLLVALMPTASTSQLMGNNECFEPFTSNLYTRSTQAGEYVIVNKHLINTLIENNLWTPEIKEEFIYDGGSIQNIDEIPQHIKDLFKTAYEMKIKPVVQQSIDRSPFVDQSQSLNIFCKEPNFKRITSSHFYGWKNGLKTGMYYLRGQPAVNPIQFGLSMKTIRRIETKRGVKKAANTNVQKDNYEACEMCSG